VSLDLIQIVDEHDKPTGSASADEAQEKGLLHRIVRIMVEDADGRILLQKRGPSMETFPNCWDHSAAGHVDAGETYGQAAKRELAEEVGIKNVKLERVADYHTMGSFGWRKLKRFNRLYKVRVASDVKLKLQASELCDARWFTGAEVKKLMVEHPDDVTDGLQYVIGRFY
jgi:16S rRNA (adenine1518-N6/adenine1519-N6)-dimethyltransferase